MLDRVTDLILGLLQSLGFLMTDRFYALLKSKALVADATAFLHQTYGEDWFEAIWESLPEESQTRLEQKKES